MSNPNIKTLETFFKAVSTGDTEKLASLYTPDFTLEMPFVDYDGVRLEGLDTVAEFLSDAMSRFQLELIPKKIYETSDPDLLIAEYRSQGQFLPEGVPYDNRYISIFRFREQKICEVVEFFNPLRSDINLCKERTDS